jgi:4a-hydroxytetrahydrobiopterin dehydratase
MSRIKLTDSQISDNLSKLSGWELINGQISKQYTFSTYKAGLVFATVVGHLADQMDHHPDLFIGYQKVRVSLNTHDVGGISELDFELAGKIDSIA